MLSQAIKSTVDIPKEFELKKQRRDDEKVRAREREAEERRRLDDLIQQGDKQEKQRRIERREQLRQSKENDKNEYLTKKDI